MNLSILYRGPLSSCNYACDYCPFAKHTETPDELAYDRVCLDRFVGWVGSRSRDSIGVLFTPWGEALVRKWYQSALAALTRMPNVVKAAIQTNISCKLDWVEECDKAKLALWCTFHPSETTRDRFLAKCRELLARGVRFSVGVVGLKEHLAEIESLRSELPPDVYLWVNAYKRGRNADRPTPPTPLPTERGEKEVLPLASDTPSRESASPPSADSPLPVGRGVGGVGLLSAGKGEKEAPSLSAFADTQEATPAFSPLPFREGGPGGVGFPRVGGLGLPPTAHDSSYYTPEMLADLTRVDPLFPLNNTYHPSLGESCRAGASVISVDGDGTVRRCHFIKEPIGNIYDADFESCLRERLCTNATCGCHIGYVHLDRLKLYDTFGSGVLERIPLGYR